MSGKSLDYTGRTARFPETRAIQQEFKQEESIIVGNNQCGDSEDFFMPLTPKLKIE